MPVISVRKDPKTLSMTVSAEFAATVDRVWQLWEDPRQLERWWGPPTYPATFEELDLRPGGRARYYMTGPEGDKPHGWWQVLAAERPTRIEILDGFADPQGKPLDDMPSTTMHVSISPIETGTRMEIRSVFPSLEAMEQLTAMGMEEGLKEALGQIDDILAAQRLPA
jgi:uncharacterized protein YndB with AHSA1/START domain